MPCDDWLHCRCYKRRTILWVALAPLLAGSARGAGQEGEAAKPPAPDDRFVFLTGPKKGQLVRAEALRSAVRRCRPFRWLRTARCAVTAASIW